MRSGLEMTQNLKVVDEEMMILEQDVSVVMRLVKADACLVMTVMTVIMLWCRKMLGGRVGLDILLATCEMLMALLVWVKKSRKWILRFFQVLLSLVYLSN